MHTARVPEWDRNSWTSDRALVDFYSVSRNTIWRWSREGKIPPRERLSSVCVRRTQGYTVDISLARDMLAVYPSMTGGLQDGARQPFQE